MKITSQSADTLVLTESGTSGMVMGVVFVVAGLAVGFFLRSSHPMAIWAALWVVVIGLVVICISSSITVEADRASGQLCYQKKVLIGGQDSTYAIADVLRIEIRKEWHINTDARGQWRINADAVCRTGLRRFDRQLTSTLGPVSDGFAVHPSAPKGERPC